MLAKLTIEEALEIKVLIGDRTAAGGQTAGHRAPFPCPAPRRQPRRSDRRQRLAASGRDHDAPTLCSSSTNCRSLASRSCR
jgi:hypothetical protein